jgi:hypothetical protein
MAGESMQELLIVCFDYCAQRTLNCLGGLTDEEYFWEPVTGCWNVRPGADAAGVFTQDWEFPAPDPPPLTTIAWRLVHICLFLQEHGMRAVAFERGAPAWRPPSVIPGSAAAAVNALATAVTAWRRDLSSVDDQRLWEPMGRAPDHLPNSRWWVSSNTSTTSSSTTVPRLPSSGTSFALAWAAGRS